MIVPVINSHRPKGLKPIVGMLTSRCFPSAEVLHTSGRLVITFMTLSPEVHRMLAVNNLNHRFKLNKMRLFGVSYAKLDLQTDYWPVVGQRYLIFSAVV